MSQNIPLQSLIFFEASARHKSFTRAAQELYVTQSAVSKQIKSLENYLERPLFERKYHNVQLTSDGENLFNEIQPLIIEIKNSILSLKTKNNSKTVNVICTHAVAHYFLFPKVVLFNQSYPDITINIMSTNSIEDKDLIENDFGILYGNGNHSNLICHKLFDEEIYPVASSNYDISQISHPMDLLKLKLIQLDPKKWIWMNWNTWFSNFKISYKAPTELPVYNQVTLALNASALGFGVTLGWDFMVKDMIRNNTLRPVGNFSIKTGYSDYLVFPKRKTLSNSALLFKDWLINQDL